jgi:hypothetical protein
MKSFSVDIREAEEESDGVRPELGSRDNQAINTFT